jgi:hypothetical protein
MWLQVRGSAVGQIQGCESLCGLPFEQHEAGLHAEMSGYSVRPPWWHLDSVLRHLIIGTLGSMLTACGSPSQPSSALPGLALPGSAPSNVETHIRGAVRDTAFRPLAGARIDILDGPLAGRRRLADENGAFEFVGTANGSVKVRAASDGFESETVTASWQPLTSFNWTSVLLKTLEPSLTFTPGPYTLTITNDLATATDHIFACMGFPSELATRTYGGSISVSSNPGNSYFFSALPGNPTQIKVKSGSLLIGVAGQFVGIQNDGDFSFIEEFPGFRYLTVLPSAAASRPATLAGTSITVPAEAEFRYCQLKSPLGAANDCSQVTDQIIDSRWCFSTHDTMVFTKR